MAVGIIQDGKFVYDPFQSEDYAFEEISGTDEKHVVYLTGSRIEVQLFKSLKEPDNWIDNSQDTNNPPDFINSNSGFMLEFMIVNDYEKTTNKGTAINMPAKEGALAAEEVKAANLKEIFPDIRNIAFDYEDNMVPDYKQYYRNFCRVIDRHKKQIPKYRTNHPECSKLCFVVCDLSEHEHFLEIRTSDRTEKKSGHPCNDIEFLRKIKQCGADLVIWFSPYISPPHGGTAKLLIIDVAALIPEKHGVRINVD